MSRRITGHSAILTLAVVVATLAACGSQTDPNRVVGQLESDRVELNADAAEPVIEILATEGKQVRAGQVLLRLDPARLQSRIAEAEAVAAEADARLAELTRGPRAEQIAAARANVSAGDRDLAFRQIEQQRAEDLLARKLGPPDDVDRTRAAKDAAAAQLAFHRARLRELLEGTTLEELAQAEQRVAQARARLDGLAIDLERLTIRAPVAGQVDTVLFESGERPLAGQTLVVLLAGRQAYARVYVPEPIRVAVTPDTRARLFVDGYDRALTGRVRRIASEPAFTPYFALTEHDRGRLSFVAEIEILDDVARLPDGVPVEASFDLAEPGAILPKNR